MAGGARHVGLVRGVNVGGRRSLPMAELRRLVEAAGGEDAETYVASGNVLFRAHDPEEVARAVERGLAARLGLDVRVLVRSAAELAGVLAANPFPHADPRTLHVTFLAGVAATTRNWRTVTALAELARG
jgi:uncharacterized protein (DUF1697 family)